MTLAYLGAVDRKCHQGAIPFPKVATVKFDRSREAGASRSRSKGSTGCSACCTSQSPLNAITSVPSAPARNATSAASTLRVRPVFSIALLFKPWLDGLVIRRTIQGARNCIYRQAASRFQESLPRTEWGYGFTTR